MVKSALLKAIAKDCKNLDQDTLQEMISHMDQDYLSHCASSEISDHIEMIRTLKPRHPVSLRITPGLSGFYKIVVVAYDYFSEFSIICGLLSSFGLNVEGGYVQTVSSTHDREKIIDLFHIREIGNSRFNQERQHLFKVELEVLIGLLEKGLFREARNKVNHFLISHISQLQDDCPSSQEPLKGLLAPIQIRFDNNRSNRWTILSIHGEDTPAFLYAFSNALAMRNIYIHKIKIDYMAKKIHDRIYISNRHGKKMSRESDKKALRVTAVLIKQFIHFLPMAPDPMMAITHFDQFLDKILETTDSRPLITFLKQKETMDLLARFFGTSNFLWEDFLRIRFGDLFPILEQYKKTPLKTGKAVMRRKLGKRLRLLVDSASKRADFESRRKVVNDYKDEEMFRIDLRHLHESREKLTHFSEALSDLAEVILDATYQICRDLLEEKHGTPRNENGRPTPFAIFGLGKFGGRELGYASDIELLFVYGGPGQSDGAIPLENNLYFDKLTQEIIRFIDARQAGIFHIDTRLRPYGASGQWAISSRQFETYYAQTGKAAPFERQALIKLRAVAGSRSLGIQCEKARDQFVFSGAKWDLDKALHLRLRQLDELVPKGRTNVKYSKGGVVDIEYLVQSLQIMHGKEISALRTPNTMEGLSLLSKNRIIPHEDAQQLKKDYHFLRSLIDALRMVRGNARDLLLPDPASEEFIFLARRMGYTSRDWHHASSQLEEAIMLSMSEAHKHYQCLFKNQTSL